MRRYLFVLTGVLGLTLALILAANLKLGDRGLGNLAVTRAASEWQQATRGVTYAPPVGGSGPFKVLRLADRLPDINALVLGSSTLMGVTPAVLPASWRVYNLTVTGNPTGAIAAEARYVEQHFASGVRWMLAGLDWSVGNLYQPGAVGEADLSPASVPKAYAAEKAVPLVKRLEDALSWPRVSTLAGVFSGALKNDNKIRYLQQSLFEAGGAEYRCADGAAVTVARDFDVINRGLCRGYRYDGSWTFANDSRLSAAQAATLAAAAAAPSSKYTKLLCAAEGHPNAAYLQHLGESAGRFAAKGGQMIFVLPALAPGLERALMGNARWRECLARTKATLDAWAKQHRVMIIDAGAAELYGCVSTEFSDEHHAYPECYQRVLPLFFRELEAGRVTPGLWKPDRAAAT
mgnify:CR=1 FL=1